MCLGTFSGNRNISRSPDDSCSKQVYGNGYCIITRIINKARVYKLKAGQSWKCHANKLWRLATAIATGARPTLLSMATLTFMPPSVFSAPMQ